MRTLFFTLSITLSLSCYKSLAQTDSTKADTVSTKLKNSLLPIPVIGSSQERGFEFGVASIYSFYLDKSSIDQRNSTIGLIASYTTKNQSKASLSANLWSKAHKWHTTGDIKYYNFPNYFYGIGDNTKEIDKDLINDRKVRISVDAERAVNKNFYLGVGAWFLHEFISEKDAPGIYSSSNLEGKSGGNITFLSFSATYDNRDIVNYPHKGAFLRFYIQNSLKALASNYNFVLLTLDARKYWMLHPTTTLAVQGYGQSLQGGDQPFFMIPQMGNDLLMRGYYTGRYRDQNYLAAQAEVRYRPFANRPDKGWFSLSRGVIAAFVGGGSVFNNSDWGAISLKPNYGIGGRYIFDPRNRLTLRIDYGFGNKNPGEKRSQGFYLSLNEAF